RLGIFGYYIPSSVIRGMLAAIGLILILKQIPHALGFDADYEGDLAFAQADGRNTFTEIPYALGHMHLGATIISSACLAVLIIAPRIPFLAKLRLLPPPLLAVILGVVLNLIFGSMAPALAVHGDLLVKIPELSGPSSLIVATPDFSRIGESEVWIAAATLAAVASIETLLCVEAVDKLDAFKRITPANRELKAQGAGNIIAGLLGGLPMTAVIVRGSANVNSGGRTPTSSFLHGVWLLLALLLVPGFLNSIPNAALAAVLLVVGYKLAPIRLFREMWGHGWNQFLPFLITVLAILRTDLLVGVGIGLVVAVFFLLRANLSTAYFLHDDEMEVREDGTNDLSINMVLSEHVSFLNKAAVNRALHDIPEGARVRI
ncbi:MAG: SulP family inorganic anion transporter, partial [Myxococcota bacterium]